ncbi:MAG TPA: cell division protein SepF [Acidimicrobiia bacterium]|nr:cell division protein SepF [Acidimicrobiia bacterium]
MGSIFSKALVYLGLVDEDPTDPDSRAVEEMPPPLRRPEGRRGMAEDNERDEWSPSDSRREEGRRTEPRRPEARRVESVSRVEGRRVEPPSSASRISSIRGADDTLPVRAVRTMDAQADILVVEEFGDAKILADRVRDRIPVVLDLRRTDPDLVRRVIDFGSGLIYALDGTMSKVGEGVVIVLPPRVTLSRDERRRLERLGVYDMQVED